MSLIYALIDQDKGPKSCLHTFSNKELAERAKALYHLDSSLVVPIPMDASEESLQTWQNGGELLSVFFFPHTWGGGIAFTSFAEYQSAKSALPHPVPYVEGVLDGLRNSVEKGLMLYRVEMHQDKEVVKVYHAMELDAYRISTSHLYSIDPNLRQSEAYRGSDNGTPYFVYAYARDKAHAIEVATPALHSRIEQDVDQLTAFYSPSTLDP